MRKPIIGINGPPESGKTFIMGKLQRMLPHATTISIQNGLYSMFLDHLFYSDPEMLAQMPPTYTEWKSSPAFDRPRLIRFAQEARESKGERVFVDYCAGLEEFKQAEVVIFDNVGLPADHAWAAEIGAPYLLLRIETPYALLEPTKSERLRQLDHVWHGDSRQPFAHRFTLSAYDSQQMSLLLDYLVDWRQNKESGPYHEYHQLWLQSFAGR